MKTGNLEIKFEGKLNDIDFLYAGSKNSEGLAFFHGFSVPPEFYDSLLNKLSNDFRIISPKIFGINKFKPQPETIDHYVEMTETFFREFKNSNNGYFGKFNPAFIVGHSIGATVAISLSEEMEKNHTNLEGVVAINPILHGNQSAFGLFRRGLKVGLDAMEKKKVGFYPSMIPNYLINLMKGPIAVPSIISDIAQYNFDHDDGTPLKIETPTLIILSKNDQLFGDCITKENLKIIDEVFSDYEIIENDAQHDYPLEFPSSVYEDVMYWVDKVKSNSD